MPNIVRVLGLKMNSLKYLKTEKLVLSCFVLFAAHNAYSMLEFVAGTGAVCTAGGYMIPRAMQELEKAQGSAAQVIEEMQRIVAITEADETIDTALSVCQNIMNLLDSKPMVRPLNSDERALRYCLREAQIFCERWGPSILWSTGAILIGGYGITLMAEGVDQSRIVRAGVGAASIAAGALIAKKGIPVWEKYEAVRKRLDQTSRAHNGIRSQIGSLNTALREISSEKQKKDESAQNILDKIGNAFSAAFGDKTKEKDYKNELNRLSKEANQINQRLALCKQEKSKISAKLLAYSAGVAGCGLAGLVLLATSAY